MSRILLITGDAGGAETLFAVHRYQEAGYQPVIAAPAKRYLNLVIHDFEPGWDTYIEKPGYKARSDINFDEVNVDDYTAIQILGGRAPEYLRHDDKLLAIVREFDEKYKWIFSICHGIQVLIAAGLVRDRKVTCYEHVRFEVAAAGGNWCTPQAVRDDRLVTAQTWESHPDFYREVFSCLENVTKK